MELSFLTKESHHAILLTHPNRKDFTEELWGKLRNESHAHRLFDTTVLDIDAAREVLHWAKSPYDGTRIGLISFHTIGIPAQNALLKILEEPPVRTRFILLTSNKANLIETVLSRLHHIQTNVITENEEQDVKIFLATHPTERMKLVCVSNLLGRTDEEGRKDREGVRAFILSIVGLLSQDVALSRYVSETLEVSSYAGDPSASGKALLEYLSLLLPQTKS